MSVIEEMSATLGIDIEAATPAQLAKRIFDYCGEMAECYDAGSPEANTFEALQVAMLKIHGGTFNAD